MPFNEYPGNMAVRHMFWEVGGSLTSVAGSEEPQVTSLHH